jgi:hypothetical protein
MRDIAILKTSRPVPPQLLRLAFFEALILLRSKEEGRRFKSPDLGEGFVETRRTFVNMGCFGGIVCEVVADHASGTTRFTCIVDDPGPDVLDPRDPVHYATVFSPAENPLEVIARIRTAQARAEAAVHNPPN